MSKIEATAKGTTGRNYSTSVLNIPGTADHAAFAVFMGGQTNVNEYAMRQVLVIIQGRLRALAGDTKRIYTQKEIDTTIIETMEGIRKGPAARVDKVVKLTNEVSKLTAEQKAALLAALTTK